MRQCKKLFGCDAYALSNMLNVSLTTAYRFIDKPLSMSVEQMILLSEVLGISVETIVNTFKERNIL